MLVFMSKLGIYIPLKIQPLFQDSHHKMYMYILSLPHIMK